MNRFFNWLHYQIAYVGSAAVVAYLAVLMSSPVSQQPLEWAVAAQDGAEPACVVDAATGAYAVVLEGQPACTPASTLPTGD